MTALPPPMAGSDRARGAVAPALELVGAVRDGDAARVEALLQHDDLPALVVVLAAMVDDHRRPSDLLAWCERQPDLDGWAWPSVVAAHRRYEQHRAAGRLDELGALDREGQRIYDRVKHRERRHRLAQQRELKHQLARTLGISA